MKEFEYVEPFNNQDLSKYKLEDLRGWIYVVASTNFPGYVKIGRTVDVHKRMIAYNSNAPYNHIRLLVLSECFKNCKLVEKKILEYLYVQISHTTAKLEWFSVRHFDLIKEVIKKAESRFETLT